MIKNLIFDIGNVITTEVNAAAFDNLSQAQQEELSNLAIYKNDNFIKTLLGHLTVEDCKNRLVAQYPQYQKEIQELFDENMQDRFLPKKPEMIELLYNLRSHYKIFFLSDMIETTYRYLKDLLDDFDGGVYSYQEHLKKPDEKVFEVLLQRYGLKPEECLFFDDKQRNVDAARKLGLRAEVFLNKETVTSTLRELES